MMSDTGEVLLHEFDRDEWWDIMRRAKPDIRREEFDAYWEVFQRDKAEREKRRALQ